MFRFRPPIIPVSPPMFGGWTAQRAAWKAQRAAWKAQRAAWKAQQRRPRSFIGRLFGFAWGMFWILFGLSFVFGGSEYRHEVIGFLQDAGRYAAELFRGLMRGAWIQ